MEQSSIYVNLIKKKKKKKKVGKIVLIDMSFHTSTKRYVIIFKNSIIRKVV